MKRYVGLICDLSIFAGVVLIFNLWIGVNPFSALWEVATSHWAITPLFVMILFLRQIRRKRK